MLRRLTSSFAALALAAASALAQQPVPAAAPKPALADLFTAARADAAGIVPLILEASAQFPTLDPARAKQVGDALEPFLARVYFGPERLPGMDRLGLVLHKVEKGENPTKIGEHYRVGAKMLAYLNEGFDDKKLRIGSELKVLDLSKGGVEVDVAKGMYRLAVWRTLPQGGHALVLFAPVGLGAAESPTPVGRTTVVKRVLDPPWTDPTTNQTYVPSDPRNVLGGYWIALDAAGIGQSGIGLHGFTGAPEGDWIAKPASHGCVRMLQHDIDRVFQLALEGTPVAIVD